MRKVIKDMVLGMVVVAAVFAILGVCGWIETHYTIKGTVTDIDNDCVCVITEDGNLWEFLGDDFNINDAVKMVMDTNCTYDITDDIIEKVEKIF